MASPSVTLIFDRGAARTSKHEQALKKIEPQRRGFKKVIFPANAFDVTAVKACPICKQGSPITWDGRFCCRDCMVLFP